MARRLIASFDDDCVVAYQAYDAELGAEVLERGGLGGRWRTDRHTRLAMSWAFTAERYAFGERPGRSHLVALHIARGGFDAMLTASLNSEWDPALYQTKASWRLATRFAPVLVEWHGDTPRLVVHGPLVRQLATTWVTGVREVTSTFRGVRDTGSGAPIECDYPVKDDVALRMGLRS